MAVMDAGTEFGGYRIERLLGAGGFCNVYLAEDLRPALRRKVALKVLNPTLSADDKNRERFQRESLLAVELDDHPNIVGVLDAGEQDGQLFIAQRYIEGRDLGKTIEESGPLSAEPGRRGHDRDRRGARRRPRSGSGAPRRQAPQHPHPRAGRAAASWRTSG